MGISQPAPRHHIVYTGGFGAPHIASSL